MLKRTRHLGMSDAVRSDRKACIGGSDAKIIMSGDQEAIERLWREKRGEIEAEDLSHVLVVQLGNCTENLNTDWFEMQTGLVVTDEQTRPAYSEWHTAMSTLDGLVRETSDGEPLGIFEAKFMLPFYFTPEKALEKYGPQVQHNMMVTGMDKAWLSVITGGGQYCLQEVMADPFYQIILLEAEKDFWDCVQTGRVPGCPAVQAPKAEPVKIVDMRESNSWAEVAGILVGTKTAAEKHEKAKKEIKTLFPDDAKEAVGHGVKLARSKDGKVLMTFDKKEIAAADQRVKEIIEAAQLVAA